MPSVHAWTGAATLGMGTVHTAASILWGETKKETSAYLLSTLANAWSGARAAAGGDAEAFRACAAMQACFVYTTWRIGTKSPPHRCVDAANLIATLLLSSRLVILAAGDARRGVRAGVAAGLAALAPTLAYPAQFAVGGQEWWEKCVLPRFPRQAEAMVAYIYVPLTCAFAWLLFAATLFRRRRISTWSAAPCVLAVLAAAVVAQEVHLPEPASTQKLWISCDASSSSSAEQWMDVVTPLAKRIVAMMGGKR